MSDISNKMRFFKVKELIERETDEEHELSINEIIRKLQDEFGSDYRVDHKAIKRDINELNSDNYEIFESIGKSGKKYYSLKNRKFEIFELRLLIDAVLSARFITKKQSDTLIKKIKELTSVYNAKKLPSQIYYQSAVKGYHVPTKIDIDQIHSAINKNKKIKFKYGKFNMYKEFVLNREGSEYIVKPYALVWNNDFYYLIGKFEEEDNFRHYRVDRMRNVEVLAQSFKKDSIDMTEYVQKSFNMYSGESETVKIIFDKGLINVVIDRFGLDAEIKPLDEYRFELRTNAKVSEGLIRWILTWGSDAQVIYPNHLVEKIKEEANKMQQLYEK